MRITQKQRRQIRLHFLVEFAVSLHCHCFLDQSVREPHYSHIWQSIPCCNAFPALGDGICSDCLNIVSSECRFPLVSVTVSQVAELEIKL